jgi:hypothetical protein
MTTTQIDNKPEFLGRMSMLLRTLEAGTSLKIRDSPISSIAEIASELIAQLSTMLSGHPKWGLLPNKGIKFVESIEVPNDTNSGYFDALSVPRADGSKENGDPYGRILGEAYYEYAGDPLGNPLQVEISFDDPSRSIPIKDRLEMADLLMDFSFFLSDLQKGKIGWQFMRQVRQIHKATLPNSHTNRSPATYIEKAGDGIPISEDERKLRNSDRRRRNKAFYRERRQRARSQKHQR